MLSVPCVHVTHFRHCIVHALFSLALALCASLGFNCIIFNDLVTPSVPSHARMPHLVTPALLSSCPPPSDRLHHLDLGLAHAPKGRPRVRPWAILPPGLLPSVLLCTQITPIPYLFPSFLFIRFNIVSSSQAFAAVAFFFFFSSPFRVQCSPVFLYQDTSTER